MLSCVLSFSSKKKPVVPAMFFPQKSAGRVTMSSRRLLFIKTRQNILWVAYFLSSKTCPTTCHELRAGSASKYKYLQIGDLLSFSATIFFFLLSQNTRTHKRCVPSFSLNNRFPESHVPLHQYQPSKYHVGVSRLFCPSWTCPKPNYAFYTVAGSSSPPPLEMDELNAVWSNFCAPVSKCFWCAKATNIQIRQKCPELHQRTPHGSASGIEFSFWVL